MKIMRLLFCNNNECRFVGKMPMIINHWENQRSNPTPVGRIWKRRGGKIRLVMLKPIHCLSVARHNIGKFKILKTTPSFTEFYALFIAVFKLYIQNFLYLAISC